MQTCIRELHPSAQYVHCKSHALSLAIVDATTLPVVRNALDSVKEILSLVTASPKRLHCYFDDSDTKQRLQKFSDTRWS